MPLFFIVSGYFYKQKPFIKQLKTDARRLLFPFSFITIVSYLFITLQDVYVGHHVIHPDSPAWFLLALFGAKTLYNILNIIVPRYKFFLSFILSSIPCLISVWYDIPRNIAITSSCICAVIFVAIGDGIRRLNYLSYLDNHKYASLLVAIILWLYSSVFGGVDLHLCHFKLWVVDFIGACAGTYLCYYISRIIVINTSKSARLLSILGYYSLIVYSFHAIEYVFPSWYQICSVFKICPLFFVFVVRVSLCCIVSWLALKSSNLRKIFYSQSIS